MEHISEHLVDLCLHEPVDSSPRPFIVEPEQGPGKDQFTPPTIATLTQNVKVDIDQLHQLNQYFEPYTAADISVSRREAQVQSVLMAPVVGSDVRLGGELKTSCGSAIPINTQRVAFIMMQAPSGIPDIDFTASFSADKEPPIYTPEAGLRVERLKMLAQSASQATTTQVMTNCGNKAWISQPSVIGTISGRIQLDEEYRTRAELYEMTVAVEEGSTCSLDDKHSMWDSVQDMAMESVSSGSLRSSTCSTGIRDGRSAGSARMRSSRGHSRAGGGVVKNRSGTNSVRDKAATRSRFSAALEYMDWETDL